MQVSSSFELLNEKVKQLLWRLEWGSLRDIQEKAIEPILVQHTDVVISAPTAAGKTEAAFLPILSSLSSNPRPGLGCLYISPLKALINDQFDRLELFCNQLGVTIQKWHGDVNQSRKNEVLNHAINILLITPESLEALFVHRGHSIPTLFESLSYIVVDELHSFIGSERGKQLQSLLRRIEVSTKRTIPRIALSATLGDLEFATQYLRPERNRSATIIESQSGGQEIKLQIRGFEIKEKAPENLFVDTASNEDDDSLESAYGDKIEIAQHLLKSLRGSNNLIFANSRSNTEQYADLLRELSERQHVPNEFYPHHGSLSRDLREDVEQRLKAQALPTTAVCTSTLELGIDIGSVKSIAQIGTPPSVSSMRQRLGRSGRRGEPAVMRIYIQEKEVTQHSSPLDCLRPQLVQSIALVNLLIKGWYEKPKDARLHLSTLIQQILSLLSQYGSLTAQELWRVLSLNAPFQSINQPVFSELLRCLGSADIISQSSDGSIVLGIKGERIVSHYSFYSAFTTPQEYQVYNSGKLLGTIPVSTTLSEGLCIVFSGRRWKVLSIDVDRRIIDVQHARGGKPPVFSGEGSSISKEVRNEMFAIYQSADVPAFLDRKATVLLAEARSFFQRYGLGGNNMLQQREDVLLFLWDSDVVANTILLQLKRLGFEVFNEGLALYISKTNSQIVNNALQRIVVTGFEQPTILASSVVNKVIEKYDSLLNEDLLNQEYAARFIDIEESRNLLLKT
ncbi:MAG: DEAD/DEAH box helicase [Bacteroidetes bacterium]|nr:DEAD/DEAH box helicase [Bacteroidota bacterium]